MKLLKGVYVIVKMGTVVLLVGLTFTAYPFFFQQYGSVGAVVLTLLAIFWLVIFQAKNIKELKAV